MRTVKEERSEINPNTLPKMRFMLLVLVPIYLHYNTNTHLTNDVRIKIFVALKCCFCFHRTCSRFETNNHYGISQFCCH